MQDTEPTAARSSQGRSGRKPAQPVRPASRPRQAESETRPAGARWRRRRSQRSPAALWLAARGSGRDQPQKRTVVHQAREQQPRPSQHPGWTRRTPRTSRGRRGTWGRGHGTGPSGKMSPHAATGTDARTAGTPPRGQSRSPAQLWGHDRAPDSPPQAQQEMNA